MDAPTRDRQLLGELLAPPADPPVAAPDSETLVDYLAGRLGEPEADRVRAWVAARPEAATRLLELAPFATATPPSDAVADFETRAAWRDFERRLRADETAAVEPGAVRRPGRWQAAIAAVFVLTAGGLALRVWQLEGALRRPIANLRTLELVGETRAGATPARFAIVAGEPFRVALFPAALPAGCVAYDAVLRDDRGVPLAEIAGLAPDPRGRLDLLLAGEPGGRRLELEACGESRGEFRFELVAE